MREDTRIKMFNEFYENDSGILYRNFNVAVSGRHFAYGIYWAAPEIVFNEDIIRMMPLAITVIKHPKHKIFLHEKLKPEHKDIFEYVVAHEVGHLWLYDIINIRQEFSGDELEIWADYFAYSFLVKYRRLSGLEQFDNILNDTLRLQGKIYNVDSALFNDIFHRKMEDVKSLIGTIEAERRNGDIYRSQIEKTIEPMLNAVGDLFDMPQPLDGLSIS